MIPRRCRSRRGARGFTLIEVLLALLLSSALLAGLWAALEISLRMFETGRTRVEEAQLTRALLNQLNNDLQQTILQSSQPAAGEVLAPPDPPAGDNSQTHSSQSSLAGILPLSRSADRTLPASSQPFVGAASQATAVRKPGLCGSAHELRLDLCRVVPGEIAMIKHRDLTAAETLELRTVFYFLARALPAERAALGSPAYAGEALVRHETRWLDSPGAEQTIKPAGLAGSSQDQLLEEFVALEDRFEASQQSEFDTQAPETVPDELAIAPEVAGLEFRYFDGVEWLPSWDSDAQGGLPAAVEIVLAVRPILNQRQLRADAAANESAETAPELPTARLVVQLPLGGSPSASMGLDDPSADEFGFGPPASAPPPTNQFDGSRP